MIALELRCTATCKQQAETQIYILMYSYQSSLAHPVVSALHLTAKLGLVLFDICRLLQELALVEYTLLIFPPSVVAAAAVLLAQSYDNVFTCDVPNAK